MSFDEAKARADADEASLSKEQAQVLIEAQAKAGSEAHATCIPPGYKVELDPYTVVMELDASGRVVRTWLHGSTPLAQCFNREMAHKTLSKPPRAPFYTSFDMRWDS
jgi:hypothetical protein